MKKSAFSLLVMAASLAFTSCSSDDVFTPTGEGDVTVSFTAQLPGAPQGRAFGDGTTATQLTYALYEVEENGDLTQIGETDKTKTFADLKTTVTLKLVNGKGYKVLFWADAAAGSPYSFDAATQTITADYTGVVSNVEARDAFFAVKEIEKVTGPVSETVTLKRPFAQVNVGTDDLDAPAVGDLDLKSKLTTKAYTKLNLLTGAASDQTDVTFDFAAAPQGETFPVTGYGYLSMNYLLVPADKELIDMTFTINDGAKELKSLDIKNVPVQRNYRTNIYGSLLTSEFNYNVVIEPTPDGDINPGEWNDDATEEDLKALIAAGGTVTIGKAVNEIDLSDYAAEKPLTLVLSAPVEKIYVKDFAENQHLTVMVGKDVAYPSFARKGTVPGPISNMTLEGDLTSSEKCGQINLGNMGSGNINVTIKNVAFDGTKIDAKKGAAIVENANVCTNLVVYNCTFTDLKTPAVGLNKGVDPNNDKLKPSESVTVTNCSISLADDANYNTNGLMLWNVNNVTVTGCTVENAPYHGISVRAFVSTNISKNIIKNAGEDGIKVEGQTDKTNNTSAYMPTVENISITGNSTAAKCNGIRVKMIGTFAKKATITGNTIDMTNAKEFADGEPCGILLVAKDNSVESLLNVSGNIKKGTVAENQWFSMSGFTAADGSDYSKPYNN